MDVINQLIAALASSDAETREDARNRLVEIGDDAVEPLIDTVKQATGRQSWRALKVLVSFKDQRVFDVLCDAITSSHPILRETAASELGKYGDTRATPLLVKALDDPHPNVQLWAAQALRDLGDPQAIPPLLERLPNAQSASIRYTLIEALGSLGDSSVIPAIIIYRDDDDHHVRERVEAALKKLNG
jgi:HEAT repeat protein